jgi:hypothetical protein
LSPPFTRPDYSHPNHETNSHTSRGLKDKMATTDLDQLLMMGFDKERSEMALKSSGNRKTAVTFLQLSV